MPHSRTFDCIVLVSYDVGEADRFVILLTREKGRLAARVPGARRAKSRLGSLLPLAHVDAEVKETKTGFLVTGIAAQTSSSGARAPCFGALRIPEFLAGVQACELLLALLSDEEPVPEIFDATVDLLRLRLSRAESRGSGEERHLLAYSFQLLHLLGVLPETKSSPEFLRLSAEEKTFIEGCRHTTMKQDAQPTPRLSALCERMIAEHVTRPLKAPAVAAACTT